MYGATSEKAYPWALPAWDNRPDIAHKILDRLVDSLRRRIVEMLDSPPLHRTSGSGSGRSIDGKNKCLRNTGWELLGDLLHLDEDSD